LDGFLEQPRQWKMVMKFGTWDIRSIYGAGSLKTLASKLAKYMRFEVFMVDKIQVNIFWCYEHNTTWCHNPEDLDL